jgi:hypothetical protein
VEWMPKFASLKKGEVYKLWLILAMNQWFRKSFLPRRTQKTRKIQKITFIVILSEAEG